MSIRGKLIALFVVIKVLPLIAFPLITSLLMSRRNHC